MRVRWLLAAILAACALAGVAPGHAETADPSTLPPQPGAAPARCTPQLGAPNSWSQPAEAVPVLGDPTNGWVFHSVVDPWRPCLAYRVAGDARRIERTNDGGRSWHLVFEDARTAENGTPMRITGLYVPAAGVVYASEDGNGVAVIRSDDAGATWRPANGGLAGEPVREMWFAPSDPRVAYAATQQGGTGPARFGASVAYFATRDGGAIWQALTTVRFANATGYATAIDPHDPAHVFVGISGTSDLASQRIAPGSLLLESRDFGESFATPQRLEGEIADLLAARRASGVLRLYWVTNAEPRGIRHRDEGEATWEDAGIASQVIWHGGLMDPMDNDKVLYFGRPNFQGRTDLMALFTRNGFGNHEYAEQPPLLTTRYHLGAYYVDRFGQYYIDVGVECQFVRCETGGQPADQDTWLSWRTLRFQPPDPGRAFTFGARPQASNARAGTFERVHDCTVAPREPLYPKSQKADDSGTLAFDGSRLYYTRRAETGPDDYSAVVRTVDPTTCKEVGRLVVRFDPEVYRAARKRAMSDREEGATMLPERPSIDSLAYDSVHDELWFSVTRVARAGEPFSGERTVAPFPIWAVPRAGASDERQAQLRLWTEPCGDGAIGLLSHDRVSDTLWSCGAKVPGELTRMGTSLLTCLHPLFQGTAAEGEVWYVHGWGVSTPGTIVALRADGAGFPPMRVEQYDARTCTHTDTWSILPHEYVGPPQQSPEWVSYQLVCDPLTFRAPSDPAAVAWIRTGSRFLAYKAQNLVCPSPISLAYSGAAHVDPGGRFDACATVTVPGPSAPLGAVTVGISIDDGPARTARTDATGKACVPYEVARTAAAGSTIAVKADVAADAHLLAAAATGSVLVGQLPTPPPPVVLPPPPPPPHPPPVPLPLPPAPAPAPQPGVQPAVSPPGQAVAQQGFASEKEKEVQLAHASQASTEEDAPEEDYAFSLAVIAVLAAATATAAAGLAFGRRPSLSTQPAYETGARRRKRRR